LPTLPLPTVMKKEEGGGAIFPLPPFCSPDFG